MIDRAHPRAEPLHAPRLRGTRLPDSSATPNGPRAQPEAPGGIYPDVPGLLVLSRLYREGGVDIVRLMPGGYNPPH